MRNRLLLGLVLTGLVSLAGTPASAGASTPSGFSIVASPTVPGWSQLNGVAAVSASDVWAVGRNTPPDGPTYAFDPLVEHYNGRSWSVTSADLSLSPAAYPGGILNAVAARGSAVWAAGQCQDAPLSPTDGTPMEGCVARYNGSRWVRVPLPAQFSVGSNYMSVLVFSNTNVVLGGVEYNSATVIRWNGKTWTRVSIAPETGWVSGLAGTLSTHLFASCNCSGAFAEREQPDGSWQAIDAFSGLTTWVSAASASSAENAWMVGESVGPDNQYGPTVNPLAMRWNGTTSIPISVPSYPTQHYLNGVVTTAPNNTWAVGYRETTNIFWDTLIEHYTGGSSFTDLGGPNPHGGGRLEAITVVPGDASDLWAVGGTGYVSFDQPLILHHAP